MTRHSERRRTPVVEWAALQELIDRCDVAGVVSALQDLDPVRRRALVAPLKEYERRLRSERSLESWGRQPAVAVTAAAVMPGAAALAPWLVRNDMTVRQPGPWRTITVTDVVVDVLHRRDVPWLPDLAHRLAARLPVRFDWNDLWPLVRDLVEMTGTEPPATDGFVSCWAAEHARGAGSGTGKFHRDPRLLALIPRLFEVDAVAPLFTFDGPDDALWPTTFTALADEGLLDRAIVLDGALGALQRGGRLGALRGYLRVHEVLRPTLDEVAPRARDYAALLPDAHVSVADMAQRELRRLDDEGRLDLEVLCDASRAVLLRSEKKLVRAQLDWLDAAAKRHPEHARELLPAAATAFDLDAADLQQRALAMISRHISGVDEATRAELAQAAVALPADLRARAAKLFGAHVFGADVFGAHVFGADVFQTGVGTAANGAPVPAATLVPPTPRQMPPPIGSAAELAAEVAALYAAIPDSVDPIHLERVLAGLVTMAFTDHAELAAALGPFLARSPYIRPGRPGQMPPDQRYWGGEFEELAAIIAASVVEWARPAHSPYPAVHEVPYEQQSWERIRTRRLPRLTVGLQRRLREIAIGLAYAPRPALVSTPTTLTGLIDPAELVHRLARAADEGWEPWNRDLAQALLRLPRDPDPAEAARAKELGTPAATVLALRLSQGADGSAEPMHVLTTTGRWAAAQDDLPAPRFDELSSPVQWRYGHVAHTTRWLPCWVAMLPADRETVAASLGPHLFARTHKGRGPSELLPMLADTDGPVGPSMNLALTCGLSALDPTDQAAAVDALITLASRGQLDGAALGDRLGSEVAEGHALLGRVVPGLRDVARAGAPTQVWDLIAASLPHLLPPATERPPSQLADLIALGVEVAEIARPTTPLPCLEPIAARRGSSQLVTQARRLREAVAAGR